MKLEWKKVYDANSEHAYEATVGRFVLRVRFTGSDTPWDAWLYAEGHREDDRKASTERVTLGWSINHTGQRFACMAAEKMLDAYIAPFIDTARAEAALAEREACAALVEREREKRLGFAKTSATPEFYGGQAAVLGLTVDAIRARTATATLSTDTLAAIAEARGLRVVEPEHLAELEALRAAVDEETAIDRERAEHGCGDASCIVERATGMTTNGGCRCGRRALRAALQRARKELAERGGKDGAK
jgi:hypothetical protein